MNRFQKEKALQSYCNKQNVLDCIDGTCILCKGSCEFKDYSNEQIYNAYKLMIKNTK